MKKYFATVWKAITVFYGHLSTHNGMEQSVCGVEVWLYCVSFSFYEPNKSLHDTNCSLYMALTQYKHTSTPYKESWLHIKTTWFKWSLNEKLTQYIYIFPIQIKSWCCTIVCWLHINQNGHLRQLWLLLLSCPRVKCYYNIRIRAKLYFSGAVPLL